jgi:hypothetical protein
MSNIIGKFETFGSIISYEITDDQKDKIIERLINYYSTHLYYGEGIHQDDDSIIDAPYVLSDICDDIIAFKTEDKD